MRVAKGQIPFREGDPADGLYLVERGDLILTIRSGDDVEVGAVGAVGTTATRLGVDPLSSPPSSMI